MNLYQLESSSLLATSNATFWTGIKEWEFSDVILDADTWYRVEFFTTQNDEFWIPLIDANDLNSSLIESGYCVYGSNDKAIRDFTIGGKAADNIVWQDDFEAINLWQSTNIAVEPNTVCFSGEGSMKVIFGSSNWPVLTRSVDGADCEDASGVNLWVYRTGKLEQAIYFSFENNDEYEMGAGSVAVIDNDNTALNSWTQVYLPFGVWKHDNITELKFFGNNDLIGEDVIYFDGLKIERGDVLATSTIELASGLKEWNFSDVPLDADVWYRVEFSTADNDTWGIPLIDVNDLNSSLIENGYCAYGSNDKAIRDFTVKGKAGKEHILWQDDFEAISSWQVSNITVEPNKTICYNGQSSMKATFGSSNWPVLTRLVNGADWSDAMGVHLWVYRTGSLSQSICFSFENNDEYDMGSGSIAVIDNENTALNSWTEVYLPFATWKRDNVTELKIFGNNDLIGGSVIYFDGLRVVD